MALGGPQHRSLVARLLVARGRTVPLDDIIGALWDGEPPPTARQQVHKLVSAVRRRLPGLVETVEGVGYQWAEDPQLHAWHGTPHGPQRARGAGGGAERVRGCQLEAEVARTTTKLRK